MTSNKRSENVKGALDRFESGGDLRPVEDRNRYDERRDSLPPREKELAEESGGSQTSASTSNASGWTSLWKSLINLAGHRDSTYQNE